MDSYSLFIGVIQNFGIFAAIYACYSLFADKIKAHKEEHRQIELGLLFGIMACVSMMTPILYAENIIIDSRYIIVSLPGIFFGTLAAFVSVIPPLIAGVLAGGEHHELTIMTLVVAALGGAAFGSHLRNSSKEVSLGLIVLYASVFSSLNFLIYVTGKNEWEVIRSHTHQVIAAVKDTGITVFITNICGMVILSSLLLFDMRRRKLMADLRLRERQAAQAAQSKSEFLALMSHEIRTPLNGIIGFAEVLDKTPLDESQKHFTDQIIVAGKTLLRILNDILDLSKIDSGKMVLSPETFIVRDMIKSAFELMRIDGETRGNRMVLEIATDTPNMVVMDAHRLRQILYNLLNNAVKFTSEGQVTLKASATTNASQEKCLQFKIMDTGIGISPDKQALIFDAFVQEDASTTRKFGGTGLGLNIVKRLIELMRGSIELDSAPGRGTIFTITIPYKDPGVSDLPEIAYTAPEEKSIKRGTVLIVDDTIMNLNLIKAMLQQRGYTVIAAQDGKQALQEIKLRDFDIVLMDVRMPIMNGIETTKIIRGEMNITHNKLPILALTAHTAVEEIKNCYEAGMDDVLTKPIDAQSLYRKIEEWIKGDGLSDDQQRPASGTGLFLDPNMIEQYKSFIGSDGLKQSFSDFMTDLDERIAKIEASNFDADVMSEELHALKAMAGSLGLRKLNDAADKAMNAAAGFTVTERRAEIEGFKNLAMESSIAFEIYLQQAPS